MESVSASESESKPWAFHSLTEAKWPVGIFDNRGINIKFLMSENHIAPFDSESDSDADPDRIPLLQQLFGNCICGWRALSIFLSAQGFSANLMTLGIEAPPYPIGGHHSE